MSDRVKNKPVKIYAQFNKIKKELWRYVNWSIPGIPAIILDRMCTLTVYAKRWYSTRNKAILGRIPAGRWGKPEDLTGAAVFLASQASNYINGTILTVDGGWMGR